MAAVSAQSAKATGFSAHRWPVSGGRMPPERPPAGNHVFSGRSRSPLESVMDSAFSYDNDLAIWQLYLDLLITVLIKSVHHLNAVYFIGLWI